MIDRPNDREPDDPPKIEEPTGDLFEAVTGARPDYGPASDGSEVPGAERDSGRRGPRMPSIDNYDWERAIENLARRHAPRQPDRADDDEGLDREPIFVPDNRPRSEVPAFLQVAVESSNSGSGGTPRWGTALAFAIPLVVTLGAIPVLGNLSGGWSGGLDRLFGGAADQPPGLAVQEGPNSQPLVRPADDARPAAADRGTERSTQEVPLALRYERLADPLPSPVQEIAFAVALERPALAQRRAEPSPALNPAVPDEGQTAGGPGGSVKTAEQARADLQSLTAADIESLLARGRALLELGDIASARLLFRLAAEAGDPRGAKAMGTTFDPSVLSGLPVAGLASDRSQAELWYDRSDEMPARTAAAGQAM